MPKDRVTANTPKNSGGFGRASGKVPPGLLTEFDLIRHLRRMRPLLSGPLSSILTGIGDDAAIVQPRRGHVLLASTDVLAEQVHFDIAYMTYRQVGYRAAVANLSDMAAMGATPRYALVAVALHPKTAVRDVKSLFSGVWEACTMAETAVIGGDTSTSRSSLFVCLTILGEAKEKQVLKRSGAGRGDVLYVTGTLGDSRAGWEILRHQKAGPSLRRDRDTRYLLKRHIRPTARLAESRTLAGSGVASSAIDLSDGLAGDLRHICEESSVGAVLDVRRLPVSHSLVSYAHAERKDPLDYALLGGEDYELLFTVPVKKVSQVEALIHRGQLCATPIGRMTAPREGLRIITAGGKTGPLRVRGYEHHVGMIGCRP
jgi:thiamine-monophosphate kinase